ncbi:hypothetical protein Tco_0561191 [Tanacetum coccineum]
MNQEQIQQAACDEALVPTADRVKISTTNMRIDPTLTQKEETYQVILDIIKTSPCYNAFLITANLPEIYMHQFCLTVKKVKKSSFYQFDLVDKKCQVDVELFHKILRIFPRVLDEEFIEPPSEESLLTFVIELGYKAMTDSDNQELESCGGSYVNTIKDDGVLGRLNFVSKGEDYQVYGLAISDTKLTNEIIRSAAYQTFIGLSTGLIPSKKSRGKGSKGKKATITPKKKSSITANDNLIPEPDVAFELGKSISKTEAEIAEEARRVHETHERLVTKKPTSVKESDESDGEPANRPTGVFFRDTSNASKKKSLDQSQKLKGIQVPDEPKSSSVANVVAEIDWGSEEEKVKDDDEDDMDEDDDDRKKNNAERAEEERDGDKEVTRDEQTVDDQAEDNQQEIPTVLSAPLLDVLVSVIPEQPTPPTLTPLASPLPTPSITSEAPPIRTTIPNPLLAVIQRLDDLEIKFDAWTKVRIRKKSKKTVKKQANTDTGIRRAQKKPRIQSRSQEKSTMVKLQSKKVKPWSTEVNH